MPTFGDIQYVSVANINLDLNPAKSSKAVIVNEQVCSIETALSTIAFLGFVAKYALRTKSPP